MADTPEFYTQKELADILRVTTASLRNYRKEGRFRFVKIGGRYLITAEEVEYIRKNGLRPVTEAYRKEAARVQREQRAKRKAKSEKLEPKARKASTAA